MADDVWHRILAAHSSCCGIQVLSAVRNPREEGNGDPSFFNSMGWRASEFDSFKWDEAVDAVPRLEENRGWHYRFKTSKPKMGMQLLRFAALGAEVPEGFTVLAGNSHGKLIGRVA